jgi:nucleolar pre-ribosomal-associated protein 1
MYGKVNKYLQKHPSWEIEKIPSYWIDKILLHEPEDDEGYIDEVTWLLDLLVKGLRTTQVNMLSSYLSVRVWNSLTVRQDLDIYRRAHAFEHILSLYSSPALNAGLKRKILHLLFRATQVGGSTMLITRSATISWIESQIAASDSHQMILVELTHAIYKSCDRERVDQWSGASIPFLVEQIGS